MLGGRTVETERQLQTGRPQPQRVGQVDHQLAAEVTRGGQYAGHSIERYRQHDRVGPLHSLPHREESGTSRRLRRRAMLFVRRIGHPYVIACPARAQALPSAPPTLPAPMIAICISGSYTVTESL